MKYKYLIAPTILLIVFVFTVGSVSAEDSTTATTSGGTTTIKTSNTTPASPAAGTFFNIDEINQLLKQASNSAARQQDQLQNVIMAADKMIANRLTTLNELNTRIQGDTRLTTDEKTTLTTDVQNAITGLNTLKTTIDADTDLTKARADAKQIVTNFRVYEILEPKLRLLVTLNNLQTVSTNIQALIPQIQGLISTLQGQGKDTSSITALLTDISSQLTTINTTITADTAALNGVSITSVSPQTVFTQVRNDITTIVKTDLGKIRTDFSQMRSAFRTLIIGTSETPNPSSSPVSTSSGVPVGGVLPNTTPTQNH